MTNKFKLDIDVPSGDNPLIDYARNFIVSGKIIHTEPVPENSVFIVRLFSYEGIQLRYAVSEIKNDTSIYAYHPNLTCYSEDLDPDREGVKKAGFAELVVKDITHPEKSLKNAAIKCFFSDDAFKAVIVSATDPEHGMLLYDGIGYTDENGEPYTVLPVGNYIITAELSLPDGTILAQSSKKITIGKRTDQVICRFNPLSHKLNMTEWCRKNNISIASDTLPGYLDPFIGEWTQHMGLLTMYRANDIAIYNADRIHMFVYLIDPSSTSYETELAYLQTKGIVGDSSRFFTYCYDIGEAVIGQGRTFEQKGRIVEFRPDENLKLYRIDIVDGTAEENVYRLDGTGVLDSITDLKLPEIKYGNDIALTGAVKPRQLDKKHFILRPDNTYEITDAPKKLVYIFDDGITCRFYERSLLMERVDEKSIGRSVYEFYNIFRIGEEYRNRTVKVTISAVFADGICKDTAAELTLRVI